MVAQLGQGLDRSGDFFRGESARHRGLFQGGVSWGKYLHCCVDRHPTIDSEKLSRDQIVLSLRRGLFRTFVGQLHLKTQ
jgi:hypothetical protein